MPLTRYRPRGRGRERAARLEHSTASVVNRDHLAKALQSLEAVQGRLLGLVMNLMPAKGGDAYSYYRAGYAPASPRQRAKERKQIGS